MSEKIKRRLTVADRRREVGRLIREGTTRVIDLAEILGVSSPTITRDIQKLEALAIESAVQDVNVYREKMRDRLDDIYRWALPGMQSGKPSSLNVGRRVVADLRKMYGLDAPVKVDTTVRHEDLVRSLAEQDGLDPDEAVAEVNRMMREQGFL